MASSAGLAPEAGARTAPPDLDGRILDVRSVSKSFSHGGATTPVLDRVDLALREGEFVSVIGPSGCGKSTLFNIIGGLDEADTGDVLVGGIPVRGSHRDIGMVFQEESTFPWRTVMDNVAFPLECAGKPAAERREVAQRFIDMVGLAGFERHYPRQLSGGMRQRTAIARTLAYGPRILLLDEPFAALDEQTRLLLGDKLQAICAALNQTTLFVTHNISEAVLLSDRVVVMTFRPGRIKRTLEIELPRPRSSALISSEAFSRYVGVIWEELRVEAAKGMQA
ncbi:MAG TPA: ABC transporter ATP-binding protein [Hyphomicrobiales bacterium]|nr:ABC transporter ATP-binding protein [Hyphomicrobiales bacterium]